MLLPPTALPITMSARKGHIKAKSNKLLKKIEDGTFGVSRAIIERCPLMPQHALDSLLTRLKITLSVK